MAWVPRGCFFAPILSYGMIALVSLVFYSRITAQRRSRATAPLSTTFSVALSPASSAIGDFC